MVLKLLVIIMLYLVAESMCNHLIMGDFAGKKIIHHDEMQFNRVPFIKRTKTYFYNDPNQMIIKALMMYDNLHSKATATITAGGIGFTYVNINMESERGEGLDYDIGIYS